MVEACLTEHDQERLSEEMTFELTPEETEENRKKKKKNWDFPGSLVVKTLCFQCRECGFSPWVGN